MKALQMDDARRAGARQQPRNDLLFQHAKGLARHAGVKKNRALPMSSAKPQVLPTGSSSISEPAGSIACLRLFAEITRLRRRKKSSMRRPLDSPLTVGNR